MTYFADSTIILLQLRKYAKSNLAFSPKLSLTHFASYESTIGEPVKYALHFLFYPAFFKNVNKLLYLPTPNRSYKRPNRGDHQQKISY